MGPTAATGGAGREPGGRDDNALPVPDVLPLAREAVPLEVPELAGPRYGGLLLPRSQSTQRPLSADVGAISPPPV